MNDKTIRGMTMGALRLDAWRNCHGDNRTHYPGCPCSILAIIDEQQAEIERLEADMNEVLRIATSCFERVRDDAESGVEESAEFGKEEQG